MRPHLLLAASLGLAALALTLAACQPDASALDAAEADAVTDHAYLTQPLWHDGQAEVAFYRITRSRDQYRRPADQSFVAGTYLVKHDFDAAAMSKAEGGSGVPAFKYALFYEFESGSYQYKRHWVVNSRQADLLPFKQSFTSFDWCSNLYRELAFQPDGSVARLMRSDDYGNEAGTFAYEAGAYPAAALPMLVRGLDFSGGDERTFSVVLPDGRYVPARARLAGTETVATEAGDLAAQRIVVTYDAPVPSMLGEESDTEETYWRGTDAARLLVRVEAASGRYTMTLVEALRSPYWQEDLWPRLERISARP